MRFFGYKVFCASYSEEYGALYAALSSALYSSSGGSSYGEYKTRRAALCINDVGGDNSKSMAISFAYVTSAAVSGNYAYGTWHTVKVPMNAIIAGYDNFQNIGGTGHDGKLFKLEYAEGINAEIYLSELVIVD